jgi:hypothetical protein
VISLKVRIDIRTSVVGIFQTAGNVRLNDGVTANNLTHHDFLEQCRRSPVSGS